MLRKFICQLSQPFYSVGVCHLTKNPFLAQKIAEVELKSSHGYSPQQANLENIIYLLDLPPAGYKQGCFTILWWEEVLKLLSFFHPIKPLACPTSHSQ
jgi:hypothetical protein